MASFRAFIAMDLAPLPGLESFLRDLSGVIGLKPVDADNLHITLKFLGDVEDSIVPSIEEVIKSSCEGIAPFQVEVIGSGVFPPKGGARVVWADLQGSEPMARIAERLEQGLEPLGFPPEGRAFKSHLTLARVKDPKVSNQARTIASSYQSARFGSKDVTEVLLKKSVLRPQGPEYSTVLSVKLSS
jgi:2'-5' RNA ligase